MPDKFPTRSCGGATALLVALLCVGASRAQETYKLGDGNGKEGWQKQSQLDPASPEGRLQMIRQLIADDKPKQAKKLADQWIKDYPNHPLLADAYLVRGDAKVARKDYYEALFDYEYLLRTYPASEHFTLALEREFNIATLFAAGAKRKLLGVAFVSATGEAEELFIRIQERAPGSAVGEKASLALGDFYFNRAEMNNAVEAYDLFLLNYPRSEHRERVMLASIRANLATFKGPKFDATGLLDAQARITQYEAEFPAAAERLGAEAIRVRIEESLALKAYYSGKWYEQVDKDVSAAVMYERVVEDHPRTAAAQLALQRITELTPAPTEAGDETVPGPDAPQTPADPAVPSPPEAQTPAPASDAPAEPPADPGAPAVPGEPGEPGESP